MNKFGSKRDRKEKLRKQNQHFTVDVRFLQKLIGDKLLVFVIIIPNTTLRYISVLMDEK